MIKLYDIVNYKTNIKGFWIDKGKIYTDNIRIKKLKYGYNILESKRILFNVKKQLAIFYIDKNKAYIENKQRDKTILKHCIRYKEKHLKKAYIKALLIQHKGLTIYKHKKYYIIEIWK